MTTAASPAVGMAFKIGDGASNEAFTAVAEVKTISGPNMTQDTIDVTTLDSANGWKEFLGSFKDAGEVTLNMLFKLSEWSKCYAKFILTTTANYQILLPNTEASVLDFAALCTALDLSGTVGDVVQANVTFKVSGQPTLTS